MQLSRIFILSDHATLPTPGIQCNHHGTLFIQKMTPTAQRG